MPHKKLPKRPVRKPRTIKRKPIKKTIQGKGKRDMSQKIAIASVLKMAGLSGKSRGYNFYNQPYY